MSPSELLEPDRLQSQRVPQQSLTWEVFRLRAFFLHHSASYSRSRRGKRRVDFSPACLTWLWTCHRYSSLICTEPPGWETPKRTGAEDKVPVLCFSPLDGTKWLYTLQAFTSHKTLLWKEEIVEQNLWFSPCHWKKWLFCVFLFYCTDIL